MLELLVLLLIVAAIVSLVYRATVGLVPGGLLTVLAVLLVLWLLTRP